tara:strand:- start:1422 stop:1661 length:240 start_codon:yes stop_codon:yes gene_type:complete
MELNNGNLQSFLDKNENYNLLKHNLNIDILNKIFYRTYRCLELKKKEKELYLEEEGLIECDSCGRIWDGNAQCNCFLYN